ncbi:A mating type homeodomain transcription factor [Trametes coccinea BRFM310]|uniref:A mating type homeodomain transcription factor n=1 Tax=Trametes coccinea (strain BRFM310) TaxID=1353009 RepID=A0A1Y2IQ85_TRAC3|nr:A mating type homeodomain transcription factor [Trametes coccinea BRFM310]
MALPPPTMSSLKQRLLSADRDFVSALGHGIDALVAFDRSWERLIDDVDAAFRTTGLDDDICALVHATATRIANLADSSDSQLAYCKSFTAELVDQIQDIMSNLTLTDSSDPTQTSVRTSLETSTIPNAPNTRKRQRTPSSEYDEYDGAILSSKRCRITSPALEDKCQKFPAGLACSIISNSGRHVAASTTPSSSVASNRKRRFSESEPVEPVPPCKRRYIGPRLHAVSDSFIAPRLNETKTQATATSLLHVDPDLDKSPISWLVDELAEQSSNLPSSDPINSSSNANSGGLELYDAVPNINGASLSLPNLDNLDAFLETIFLPHDSIVVPTSLAGHSTPSVPSRALRGSPSSSCSSDSDSGSSPASSTPSTPRFSPATPSLDSDILKFDLGASQYFPLNDEWAPGDELQLSSFFDVVPPLPEVKWPSSSIDSSWLDVSRLVSPSLDEDLDSLL